MTEKLFPIPSFLALPPTSEIPPPVHTAHQDLPFGELTWEDFQKLCLRLVRLEANVEHCQIYGTPGQKQEGIDLFARQKLSDRYRVYQCKKVANFGPAEIRQAVDEFLAGSWVDRTELFVLCTQESFVPTKKAEAVEIQNKILRTKGVTLIPWGADELSGMLKQLPKVVNDFFGREWVSKFIGEEAATSLGRRLDLTEVREFRSRCLHLYSHVFENHDPGIPSAQLSLPSSLSIGSRFVVPEIYDRQSAPNREVLLDQEESSVSIGGEEPPGSPVERKAPMSTVPTKHGDSLQYRHRVELEEWLGKGNDRYVVLGGAGAGKSTLLRYVALQLLSDSPSIPRLAEKWGDRLPVWIPFALWTKIISTSPLGEGSLVQTVHQWLITWDEQRLWPIFEQTLEDERVLLLIDGLDEWTNESAGRIALDRLQVFIRQRRVASVVTSRPHGYKRLGMQEEGWQVGELCELSSRQQKELATVWFAHKLFASNLNMESVEINRRALFESSGFMEELGRSPDLAELVKLPMLLCLLIFLRFQNAQLPQNRFKAYGQIVDHLLLVHPKRRKQAALITSQDEDLTDEDMKAVLSHLALKIHENYSEGLIDKNAAEEIVRERIEQGFGFERSKAISLAKHVIQTSENTVGLLVTKSPMELGFLHRTFQEFLAACGLSTISYARQSETIEKHCSDDQWHEVILALLTLTRRTEDIDNLLMRMSEKRNVSTILDRYTIQELLYEAVFVHSQCSLAYANTMTREAFRTVERESWMPHRVRVVRTVLDGLRQPRLRTAIIKKCRSWFPARGWSRTALFEGMADWDRTKEVIECIEVGILAEDGFDQRAAAKALAKVGSGDEAVGEEVLLLVKTTEIPNARAAAIEALIEGWPNNAKIASVLMAGVQSPSPEIQAISAYGKVKKGIHQADDLDLLLRLGMRSSGLNFNWREIVLQGIKLGWPGSIQVKQLCLRALGRHFHREDTLDGEIASKLLLEGYPQDKEVAAYCIDQIDHEEYPFAGSASRHELWKSIAVNFRDNPDLVAAIDRWMPIQEYSEPEVAAAALVGRTAIGKAKLLALNKKHLPFWFARSLIEGWGMSDAQVSELLTEMAYGPPAETSQIGDLLPYILRDFASCRKRLLEVIRDPNCQRPDFVIRGLQTLGKTEGDNEAIEAIVERLKSWTKVPFRHGAMSSFFASYSTDPRVRALALNELDMHEGQYGAVAKAYRHDAEIRSKVMEMVSPLPAYLRKEIVESLGKGMKDHEMGVSLLANYDLEYDANIKVEGSIAYHRLLTSQQTLPLHHVDKLKRSLFSLGFDYEQRRQGAFCGLVMLNETEYVKTAKEPWEDGQTFKLPIKTQGKPTIPFIRFLLEYWKDCKPLLFDGISDEESAIRLWEELCPLAYDYEEPRKDALNFLDGRKNKTAGPNILRFIAKAKPTSKFVLDHCLLALTKHERSQYSDQDEKTAAELLANQFAGDMDVLKLLPQAIEGHEINSSVIFALCEGWPNSEEVTKVFEYVRTNDVGLTPACLFSLVCARSKSDRVFKLIIDELANFSPGYRRRVHLLGRPILRRLQQDQELFGLFTNKLFTNPTPSEKASLSRLIATSNGVQKDLRTWCLDELRRLTNDESSPEIGVDLLVGELRPVRHSLLDVLAEG